MDANYTYDEMLGQPQKIELHTLPYSKEEKTLKFNEVHSPLQMNSCFMYKLNCQQIKEGLFLFSDITSSN